MHAFVVDGSDELFIFLVHYATDNGPGPDQQRKTGFGIGIDM